MNTIEKLREMYADAPNDVEVVKRHEAFREALHKSAAVQAERRQAGWMFDQATGTWATPPVDRNQEAIDLLSKSITPETLASLRGELAKTGAISADVAKDISLTSPLSTGMVPYDLEAPAKLLAPVFSPLRNTIPRVKGQGTARRVKRITGFSGSRTGGVATPSPFIADSTTDSFGGLTLRRPPKISYASDEKTFNYKQMGLSDSVLWSAQFAGQGFWDARSFSQGTVLKSSMLLDENAILFGRGTDAGVYLGAPSAPTIGNATMTARNAGTGETGNSANIANFYIKISAETGFGESAGSSASSSSTSMSAATGKVIDVTMTGSPTAGAYGYRIYVSTDNTNFYYAGRTAIWGGTAGQTTAAFTIQFTGGGTGGAINSGANPQGADTSSSANAYDGILTVQLDSAQSGAIYPANALFSTTNPGVEFQKVFKGLWTGSESGVLGATSGGSAVKAMPSEVWINGADRVQLSDAIKTSSANSAGFIFAAPVTDGNRVTVGNLVTGIVNEVTGDIVPLKVHPYLPQGVAPVLSRSLPIPDAEVSDPFTYCLVQDYMSMEWPVIQTTYDVSSYWYGALVHYAPTFSGCVTGIKAA